jgi:hypothetical protein
MSQYERKSHCEGRNAGCGVEGADTVGDEVKKKLYSANVFDSTQLA